MDHITSYMHPVDQSLRQLSFFSSCKLNDYNCTDVVPVNYCYFIAHVQIQLKSTVAGIFSHRNCHTPSWSAERPVYLYIRIYIIIIVFQSLADYTNSLERG
jgi:hypothetical protein